MSASADKARSYALTLLRYRGRSEKELRDRLAQKGFSEKEIEETAAYLRNARLLDDRSLAEDLQRQAVKNKLLGFDGVRRFMQQRGLPREIIDASVEYDEETELRTMRRLIAKRQKTAGHWPEPKRTKSLIGFLMRRGYRAGLIRKALKNTLRDEEMEA